MVLSYTIHLGSVAAVLRAELGHCVYRTANRSPIKKRSRPRIAMEFDLCMDFVNYSTIILVSLVNRTRGKELNHMNPCVHHSLNDSINKRVYLCCVVV